MRSLSWDEGGMGGPQTVRKTGKNKSVENSEAWCKGHTVRKALLEEQSSPLDLLEVPHGTKVGCLPSLGSRLTSQAAHLVLMPLPGIPAWVSW